MPVTIIDDDTPAQPKRKAPRKPVPDGVIPWSFPCKEYTTWMSEAQQEAEMDFDGIEPLPGFMQQQHSPAGACRCPS